jgi:hypothetical protein
LDKTWKIIDIEEFFLVMRVGYEREDKLIASTLDLYKILQKILDAHQW